MSEVNTAFPVKCEHTRLVEIGQLVPHPQNCKNHDKDAVERQAAVMEYLGWRRPITVSNLSGRVTSGHKRLLAAKLKKATHVPVSFQDYDNEDQEIADLIADNALNEWEPTSRTAVNLVVPHLGPDFDINMLGLKYFTLDIREKDAGCDEDETPETPPEPVVKRGELWILGEHRLLIDDCTVKENVERLMAGEKADMVFTDPPYNLAGNHCTSWHLAGKIWDYYSTRSNHSSYCVWSKPNPMPSLAKRHWTWASELICYATRGKHTFNFPVEGHARNVWEIKKSQKNDLHPTMKPVEVPEKAITHSSHTTARILDLFLGSGSTLIACEKTNRRCFGMEIDPHYGQVIIERYIKFTGRNDVYRLEANGHKTPWPEVAPKHSP